MTSGWALALLRQALMHAGLFVAFIALAWLSSIFQATDLKTSPWAPATGLALVAGLVLGRPAVVTVTICMLVSTRLWGWSLPGSWEWISAVTRALIFTGTGVAFKSLLMSDTANRVQTVIRLLLICLGITIVYAVARLVILGQSVGIETTYLLSYTMTLSIGNLIAMMTFVPFLLTASGMEGWKNYLAKWGAMQWLFLGGLVMVSVLVFGLRQTDEFKFFYLVFLPVVAFSVKDGLRGAALSVLLSDILMLFILYWRSYEASNATELQFLMLALSVTGLFMGAAVSDRERAVQQLAETHLSLQESQSVLLQASRLSLANEIAAALAHELSQPLSSIRNYVRAVKRRLASGSADADAVQSDIDAAVEQVDSAAGMLRSTRRFLERGTPHKESHQLRDIILSSLALFGPELRKSGIEPRAPGFLPTSTVMCNEIQIQQVILNLLRNSKDAIVASGAASGAVTIRVSVTNRPGFAEISVSDTGPGVNPELQDVLFQPLKSAKPDGLGLGLSLCSSIVRRHGGELWLDRSSKEGAAFVFTLPITSHPEESHETADHDH
ncbi:ATP-binding protein [Aestuariivirga sp.]|uniref:ATP-binding protein n=1 Tax=Aestuariivirga sp. TaxID=2650926 RepID=UPI00359322F6